MAVLNLNLTFAISGSVFMLLAIWLLLYLEPLNITVGTQSNIIYVIFWKGLIGKYLMSKIADCNCFFYYYAM